MGKKSLISFIYLLIGLFGRYVARHNYQTHSQPQSHPLLLKCCSLFSLRFQHAVAVRSDARSTTEDETKQAKRGQQMINTFLQSLTGKKQKTKKKKAHRSTTVSAVASRNVLTWQQIRPIPVERKLHAFDRRNWKSGKTARREGEKRMAFKVSRCLHGNAHAGSHLRARSTWRQV